MKYVWLWFVFPLFASVVLTEADIQEIYQKYVKVHFTDEWCHRYDNLSMIRGQTGPWKWKGRDFSRVIAVLEFERFVQERGLRSEKGLAINGMDPEWHYLPHDKIDHIHYEWDAIKYDLHQLEMEEKDYDFVILNQTLEHLYNPVQCLENIYRHMRPGGVLYINVPANTILHTVPFHYYTGYTPVGLGAVIRSAGFEIIDIGQWGNLEYIAIMYRDYDFPDYKAMHKYRHNDARYPVISWIFAKRPEKR